MSANDYIDMFEASDGDTITVRPLDGATIEVRKLDQGGKSVATVELSPAETRHVLTAKPTRPRVAWLLIGDGTNVEATTKLTGVTIAPPDVERVADALTAALEVVQ